MSSAATLIILYNDQDWFVFRKNELVGFSEHIAPSIFHFLIVSVLHQVFMSSHFTQVIADTAKRWFSNSIDNLRKESDLTEN